MFCTVTCFHYSKKVSQKLHLILPNCLLALWHDHFTCIFILKNACFGGGVHLQENDNEIIP